MNVHPWHGVSYGEEAPSFVNGIIEISNGSKAKYELEKETGMLVLDRVLSSPMYYPANYGFIPKTYCDDNDPLDILVLSQVNIVPMCLVEAKVIGVMSMIDGGEGDDKIIAVASGDPIWKHYNDISEIPQHILAEIRVFFEDYKKLEKKEVQVNGFAGAEKAREIVQQAIEDYRTKFEQ